MREIKFRAWYNGKMYYDIGIEDNEELEDDFLINAMHHKLDG